MFDQLNIELASLWAAVKWSLLPVLAWVVGEVFGLVVNLWTGLN